MKNKLSSIAILVTLLVPFVASWEGAVLATAGRNATEGTSIFLPVLDWDMSGLDARDAQNRPVQDPQASQDLTALFVSNLFSLTVLKDQHAMAEIWNELSIYSHLFKGLIFNMAYVIFQGIPKALAPSTKRFVHNVHNLWIVISVGIFFCTAGVLFAFSKPSQQRLILRC